MACDYHGWIALATSQDNWSDSDFDSGFSTLQGLLAALIPSEGHDACMLQRLILPQMVYLKGSQVESVQPAIQLLDEIGEIFDRSYGELLVFDDCGDASRRWDFAVVEQYRMVDGRLAKRD